MPNIKFNDIHEDVAEFLKFHGISEDNLYHYNSDLYVGCYTFEFARELLKGGKWESMSSIFIPQPGTDMEKYSYAVDIAFGYTKLFRDQLAEKKQIAQQRDTAFFSQFKDKS